MTDPLYRIPIQVDSGVKIQLEPDGPVWTLSEGLQPGLHRPGSVDENEHQMLLVGVEDEPSGEDVVVELALGPDGMYPRPEPPVTDQPLPTWP